MAYRNLKTWVYTDDDNRSWLRRVDDRYSSQQEGDPAAAKIGNAVATGTQLNTLPPMPPSDRPRKALVATSDGAFKGSVVVMATTSPLWGAIGGTINFFDGQGTSHAGVVYGHSGERIRHKRDIT